MDKQVTIKNITVAIGKREIELSPKEAEDLFDALAKLFGKPETVRVIEKYPYPWTVIPYSPAPFYPITYSSDTVTVTCNTNPPTKAKDI